MLVVIGGPFADFDIGEADVDPLAVRRGDDTDLARLRVQLVRAARPVDDIQCRHDVDAFEGVAMKAQTLWMAIGKSETFIDVVNRSAEGLGQFDRRVKADGHARRIFSQQQWILRRHEHIGGFFDDCRFGAIARWNFYFNISAAPSLPSSGFPASPSRRPCRRGPAARSS